MDLNHSRLNQLKLTFVLSLIMLWISASFVLGSKPEVADSDPLAELVRLPANIPAQLQPAPRVPELVEMDVLPLSCWDRSESSQEHTTSARWLRMTGKLCDHLGPSDRLEVRNLTNGYSATVFNFNNGQLTTDFMPMALGANEIQLAIHTEDGAHFEQSLHFNRE